ncbi:MAG: hypothetical protein R3F11_08320 [Verrucomicrobiales bacterium]
MPIRTQSQPSRLRVISRALRALWLGGAAMVVAGFGVGSLAAQGIDSEIEAAEAQLLQSAAAGTASSGKSAAELEQENRMLKESLAAANAESEEYLRSSRELRERLEALGVEAMLGDRAELEQRLLQAANDYRIVAEESRRLGEQLIKLSEAVVAFKERSESKDPAAVAQLEAALRDADAALGMAAERHLPAAPTALEDSRVVSIKAEAGLAVLNAGRQSGVKVGMPVRIFRKDKPVALGLVCDIRDHIAGVLVTELIDSTDTVQVGDRVQPDARSNF